MDRNTIDFEPLFYPKTMAVIGASNNPVGAVKYVKAHLNTGIKIYPVNKNPDITELEGLPVYRSILDVEDDIDLCIIGVPKEYVADVIEDFKHKIVKFAVIFTSGFKESGREDLEQAIRTKITDLSLNGGTRFIGPNCLGIYHPKGKLAFFPGWPANDEVAGNIAFIGQSGGHTAKMNMLLMSRGVFFSKTISIGNAIDLKPHHFLPYFTDDPDTNVVGMYIESTTKDDGHKFMEALKQITPVKPVVIWKGGQGDVGFKATVSHTGELAGNFKIWQAMTKQTGTILAEDFDVCADLLTMFSFHVPLLNSLRVAIVACGGGNAVETADIFELGGFKVPELKDETKEKIAEFIPDINSSFTNPVDLGEYGYFPKYFVDAVNIIANDESIDAVIYIKESARFSKFSANFNMTPEEYERVYVESLKELHDRNATGRNIPLLLNDPYLSEDLESFTWRASFRDKLAKVGIPVFGRIDVLMRALLKMREYRRFLDHVQNE